ncbi:G2/mitotic-specific cyclin [Salix suchowensis]|nr:G2/mitotic-specific cyclin [Salix suchowensis]
MSPATTTTTTRVTRTSSRLANENANAGTNAVVTRSKAQQHPSPHFYQCCRRKIQSHGSHSSIESESCQEGECPQPAVKRKREALTEVPKKIEGGKGKGKAIDDATTKPTTKVPTRQPLSTVGEALYLFGGPRSPVFTRPQPPSKLPPVVEVDDVEDDPEIQRAHKKLHTSPPEMLDNSTIEVEDVANLLSAPSQPQLWDDLDEEDHDDPAMVSEYVNDIFGYLKEVEVSRCSMFPVDVLTLLFSADHYAKPKLHGHAT